MLETADVNDFAKGLLLSTSLKGGAISRDKFIGAYETISWMRAQVNTPAVRLFCRNQVCYFRGAGCVWLYDTDCENVECVGYKSRWCVPAAY